MANISELEIFVTVVDAGSFTAAAEQLGVSKSHVSKQVSALEDRLGAQLLHRTTRSLSVTDAGQAFYERGALILEQLEEAERAVMQLQTKPRGRLKVSVPMTFGLRHLAPLVAEFLQEYPEISIDLDLSDRKVDMIDEGFDLAIRIGELQDSSLMVRKLAPATRYCCASPEYLETHGTPRHPAELADHECLEYAYGRLNTWQFVSPDGDEHFVQVSGRLRANNGEVLVESCVAGLGVALVPDFMLGDHLQSGRLVRLLDDWLEWNAGVYALYPHNRHLSAKVRRFVDFLVDKLSPAPWLQDSAAQS
jgi:DNA-binding transcriptional LysR family regulator